MASAFRALRLVPALPPKSCHARHYATLRGSICIVQERAVSSLTAPAQWQCHYRNRRAAHEPSGLDARCFSAGNDGAPTQSPSDETDDAQDDAPLLVYEGPFASLALKLKRISLTSAVIAIVGLPALSVFYGADGAIPATGQLAIIATAGATAVGSTALLGYCFSPYVHTLERLSGSTGGGDGGEVAAKGKEELARIVTRDLLARRVETTFNPATDVTPPPSNNTRPFCNFMVKGLPMYVHPELIHDYKLRVQLVGEEPQQEGAEERNKQKLDDDEFL